MHTARHVGRCANVTADFNLRSHPPAFGVVFLFREWLRVVIHGVNGYSGGGDDAGDYKKRRSASSPGDDAGADAPAAPGKPGDVGRDFIRPAEIQNATGLRSITGRAAVLPRHS